MADVTDGEGGGARLRRGVVAGLLAWVGWMGAWVAPVSSSWAAEPVYIAFDGAYGVKTNTAPKAIERGIQAAMEEINARGGLLGGRPLKLLTTDNQGVSARARDNYLDLAAKPGVVAVLGGGNSAPSSSRRCLRRSA